MIDLGLPKQIESPRLDIEIPNPSVQKGILVSGRFKCWFSRPKSGAKIGKEFYIPNGATTPGLNYLLNTGFRGTSALTTWYAGIIAGSGFTGVSANDTMSSHTGWTELTGYSESVRQTWSPAAASGGVLANSTAMAFTINSTTTAQGIFLASDSTKGGTTGTLWATAVEGSAFTVTSGVVFNAIYQITLTPVS